MDTPVESPTNHLAASTTIEEYGNVSLVTIPGCSTLSPSAREEIALKARQLQRVPADALLLALRDLTPPLDEEEEDEDSRAREAHARWELENDGCPPCYPRYLNVPLLHPPKEFEAIVGYWQSFPRTGDVVLCAQNSGWQQFRTFQWKVRRPSRRKPFSEYEDEARRRRQSYGLDGDVRLVSELERQSQLGHWIEFQAYQLERLERLKKDQSGLKQELGEVRQKPKDADAVGAECSADDAAAIEQLLGNAEWDLERHMVLLRWIEQKRLEMDPEYPETSRKQENDGQDAIPILGRRASTHVRQGRRQKSPPVLGKFRISKATPQKRRTPTQKRMGASEPKLTTQLSDVPRSSIPTTLKFRQTKSRRKTKEEKPLGQLRPQRVTKPQHPTVARQSGRQSRSTGPIRSSDRLRAKRRPATQQPQPAAQIITKSGRISNKVGS